MTVDFLIVGGGIGGLVLAELLGRGGKKVVVLERSTGPPNWSRPEILWPATIELLCQLIPRTVWENEAAVPLAGMEFFDSRHFQWAISPEVLKQAQVQPWSTDPNQTRELLMRLSSFELHRGIEVVEVLNEQGSVVGVRGRDVATGSTNEWLAMQTVGDDGVRSLVRTACGINLRSRLFPLDLLCFDCEWPAALRPNAGWAWPNLVTPSSGILVLGVLPTARSKGVGIVAVRPRVFDDLQKSSQGWNDFIRLEPGLAALLGGRKFPEDFQRVRRPWGHARRYGGRGALLMGDAAHPVSPAGGQGANMSVADGRAIAELVLAGERDLLAAYEHRRRQANRRSLRFTRAAALAFGLPERLVFNRAANWLLRQLWLRPWLVSRLIRLPATAFLER